MPENKDRPIVTMDVETTAGSFKVLTYGDPQGLLDMLDAIGNARDGMVQMPLQPSTRDDETPMQALVPADSITAIVLPATGDVEELIRNYQDQLAELRRQIRERSGGEA